MTPERRRSMNTVKKKYNYNGVNIEITTPEQKDTRPMGIQPVSKTQLIIFLVSLLILGVQLDTKGAINPVLIITEILLGVNILKDAYKSQILYFIKKHHRHHK